ncbi:hypothetical protein G3N57_01465 [Paraburkholderia sp. Se-20369]|nr:hypothetical protein [Paraburkholderia sp. Se-20369]
MVTVAWRGYEPPAGFGSTMTRLAVHVGSRPTFDDAERLLVQTPPSSRAISVRDGRPLAAPSCIDRVHQSAIEGDADRHAHARRCDRREATMHSLRAAAQTTASNTAINAAPSSAR